MVNGVLDNNKVAVICGYVNRLKSRQVWDPAASVDAPDTVSVAESAVPSVAIDDTEAVIAAVVVRSYPVAALLTVKV